MCISMQQLRVTHPQKYLEFRDHEIASEFFGGQNDISQWPDDGVSHA